VHFDRLRVVSALPPDGGWRADLAIDRSVSPPRAVLVARVPPAVSGDALSLSMLARGVDLASRVQHPSLRQLMGTGEVDGELVLVEAWREGETLRNVLDGGGPLTPSLASRVAVDVAGALHACHTLPAAGGHPLCHGGVRAERIVLAEDGQVLLCGMGRPFAEDATPEDDLRDLARLLLESLTPAAGGLPGPLAPVLDRVVMGEGYATAAAFAEAVAAVVAPAEYGAVVSRVEASQPEGMPAWLGHRRALAQALRAEEGAAADEEAPPGALAAVEAPAAPPPPSHQASAPAPATVHAGEERTIEIESSRDQFVEISRVEVPPGVPGLAAAQAGPPGAWIDHPRAPLAVLAAAGLLGLIAGLALGGR